MDPQKPAPASSEPGTTHPLPPDVVALGQRISLALRGDDDRDDPATTWIGMRIAELMRDAENAATADARRTAAEQCQDLVFAAWDGRRSWPRGWPPDSVREVTSALERLTSPKPAPTRRRTTASASWVGQLEEATENLRREQRIWSLLALSELPSEALQAWLTDSHLDEGERFDGDESVHNNRADDAIEDDESSEFSVLWAFVTHSQTAGEALCRLLRHPKSASTAAYTRTPEEITGAAVRELRRLLKARQDAIKRILSAQALDST